MNAQLSERTCWAIVMAFAIAMAWVEAASVFYIRAFVDRIEPYQANPLPLNGALGNMELWREAATLVMIATLGCSRAARGGVEPVTRRLRSAPGTSFITSSFVSSRVGRRRCSIGTSFSCCRFRGGDLYSRR